MKTNKALIVMLSESLLCFACLFYPHMDTNLFWSNPFAYFEICNYGHNFIFSTQCGLIWLLVPMIAYISISFDERWNENISSILIKCKRGIFHLILFFSIFVCIAFLFSNNTTQESSWQNVARAHAYGDLAKQSNMLYYTLFCYFQLTINLLLWEFVVALLRQLFKNNSLVFISVLVISYLWRYFVPYVWNYSIWLIPPIDCDISLLKLVRNNWIAILLVGSALFFAATASSKAAFRKKIHNSVIVKCREYIVICSLCIFIPVIMNLGSGNIFSASNSVYDIWLSIFGGVEWGHPEISIKYVYQGVICALIPFIYSSSIHYGGREEVLIKSKQGWLYFKTIAIRLILIMVFCLCIQIVAILSCKTTMSLLFYLDIDFVYCAISILLISINILILHNAYLIVHYLTFSESISQFVWLIPFWGTIFASNEDRMVNIYIPTNWSMIVRTDLFSPHVINEITADGSLRTYQLATFAPINALFGEILLLIITSVIINLLKKRKS